MSFSTMLSTMGEGMLRTCAIFFLTVLFSLPLGLVIMFLRRSRFFIVRTITKLYIAIMRGTPLMLQLLMWYFGPYYLFGMNIRGYRFAAIIIGFSMNYAAYFAEIYRGGMETIPQGQYEAAEVLGYSKAQTFFKIILPQVVKAILPSVTNEIITLVKDTSLAFTLAYNEMFSLAKQIAASQTSFVPFVVAGVFYFVVNGSRTAQWELYKKYSPVLFGICLRYSDSRETAEDILQDAFLKIYSSIGDYEGVGSFEGWMKRIAINTAITNYHQTAKHKHHEDVDDYAQSIASDDPNFDSLEFTREELLGVVNSLPDGYRMVFNMFAIEGFKHREIAEMLGIDINTSKTQFMRARNIVVKKLNELKRIKKTLTL